MKKMYLTKYFAMLLLVCIMAACSSKKSDIAYYIPNNAAMVLDINLGKMHEKGKLAEFDKTKMYSQIMSLVAMSDAKTHKVINDVMANTDVMGLNLKGEAYIYMTESYVGFLVPMKDKDKYVSFVKKQADAFGAKEEPHKLENFLGVSKDNSVFAWNDDVLYFLVGLNNQTIQQVEADFKKIVTQKDAESIISNPKYKEFAAQKKDISIMLNMESFMKFAEKMNSSVVQLPGMIDLYKGMLMNGYVEFTNDEIVINTTSEVGAKMKAMFDPTKIYKTPISDKLLKLFPANSIATLALGMNPTEALKGYQEMLKYMLANGNTAAAADDMAMFNLILTKAAPYLSKLDGEIVMALTDFKQSNIDLASQNPGMSMLPKPPMPMFGIALGIADNTVLDQLIAEYKFPIKKQGNIYKYAISEDLIVYAVNANNVLMITNDEKLAQAASDGQMPNNLTESPYKNDLMKGTFGYMNLNFETYPESAKAYFASDNFLNSLKEKVTGFDVITVESDPKTNNGSMKIKLKKTGLNSFYSMIQMIEKSI